MTPVGVSTVPNTRPAAQGRSIQAYAARFFAPRLLHPGAWWAWAIGCAVVAARTTNLAILALVITVICYTVVSRRTQAPWALAFRLYVYLAILIVVLRVFFRMMFAPYGPTVILELPTLTGPGFLSAISLFGPVSAEALLGAVASALQLAAMVLAIGAANALANPKRLLAAVPGALYEWGTVVVIALSIFPQLAESLVRVGRARQLRAEAGRRRVHLIRNVAMPVLSDGLDRSLVLAGAMDSRGYGRSASMGNSGRWLTSVLLVTSSLALCVGAYGLLDTGFTPIWMGAPMIILGLMVGLVGLRLSGRRVMRTRYRPDSMKAPEWMVLATAAAACGGIIVLGMTTPEVAFPPIPPLTWPPISLFSLVVVVVLLLPALLAPKNRDGKGQNS